MSAVEDFLSASDEEAIIKAIRKAEQQTSGEIRIHIENSSSINHNLRAKEVFHYLKMDNTKLQNAALIYVAVKDKTFVIYGDKGINDAVDHSFWESTKDLMQSHFKNGNFREALIEGVKKIGDQLSKYFPWDHGDLNELTNEISRS